MKEVKDYRKTFVIPGIDFQTFPVYAVDCTGKIVNFKEKVYPDPRSVRKWTRNKQLKNRSKQALIFDALINVGYFDGLGEIVREMPILIENSKRPAGLTRGLYYLADYYFANLRLAVELDSEYHEGEKKESADKLRDQYFLKAYGIETFRIPHLEKESTQKGRFQELKKLLKERSANGIPHQPTPLIMTTDLYDTLTRKKL